MFSPVKALRQRERDILSRNQFSLWLEKKRQNNIVQDIFAPIKIPLRPGVLRFNRNKNFLVILDKNLQLSLYNLITHTQEWSLKVEHYPGYSSGVVDNLLVSDEGVVLYISEWEDWRNRTAYPYKVQIFYEGIKTGGFDKDHDIYLESFNIINKRIFAVAKANTLIHEEWDINGILIDIIDCHIMNTLSGPMHYAASANYYIFTANKAIDRVYFTNLDIPFFVFDLITNKHSVFYLKKEPDMVINCIHIHEDLLIFGLHYDKRNETYNLFSNPKNPKLFIFNLKTGTPEITIDCGTDDGCVSRITANNQFVIFYLRETYFFNNLFCLDLNSKKIKVLDPPITSLDYFTVQKISFEIQNKYLTVCYPVSNFIKNFNRRVINLETGLIAQEIVYKGYDFNTPSFHNGIFLNITSNVVAEREAIFIEDFNIIHKDTNDNYNEGNRLI